MHDYNLRNSKDKKPSYDVITDFSNGKRRAVRHYVLGKPHGIWWSYYSNGKLKNISLYHLGELISTEDF